MKKTFLLTLFLGLFFFKLSADQLAYITKEQAELTVKKIQNKKYLYLFCGCCDNEIAQKIKISKVYFKFTGYENYYEVIVETIDESNKVKIYPLDLAYAWVKKRRKYKTIGEIMNFEHDKCTEITFQK